MGSRISGTALLETGHITAAILFLITAASVYQRMLGMARVPNAMADMLNSYALGFAAIMALYVLLMIFLGTILDTASIILIVVPLFLPIVEPMGIDLVWFGIVTVIGAEIGLLTPPLGISCFVIKSTLDDPNITLKDVFMGALPFAFVMLLVLILIIRFPVLSIGLLEATPCAPSALIRSPKRSSIIADRTPIPHTRGSGIAGQAPARFRQRDRADP